RGVRLELAVGTWARAVTERLALRDEGQQRGETIVVARGLARHFTHGRHVVVVDAAAKPERHELLGERLDELVRLREPRLAQLDPARDHGTVRELSGRIDLRCGLAILRAPRADRVEVLEREAER